MDEPRSSVVDTTVIDSPIEYATFGRWYDGFRAEVLDQALATAEASLEHALSELLSARDLARIRSITGRVKSKRRTWRKINSPRYRDHITTVDDVAEVIDDLVGLRVTCINLRDAEVVRTALDALPTAPGARLWLDPTSERDYVARPKASGYRGWHVNLGVQVGERHVVCELQVRTLLQDSWGELTHEDTYSKDGALPPLVDVLSTRMADLLAILDDVAEDLRTELDRIDQETVAGHDDGDVFDADLLAGQAADAAGMLRARWGSIERPLDLAALARELQREFGAEISDDWFGHGAFKRFVRHAVPGAEISTGRQAYLLPADGQADEGAAGEADRDDADQADDPDREQPPGPARQLRRVDAQFPLLATSDWTVLFDHLAESWRRVKPADASLGTVNRLTRSARDLSRAAGASFSRRTLDYVVKTLLAVHEEAPTAIAVPSTGRDLAAVFVDAIVQRMLELRIVDQSQGRAADGVRHWIVPPEGR